MIRARRLSLVCLMVICLLPFSAEAATECGRMTAAEKQAAQKKYGDRPFYEHYQAGVQAIKKSDWPRAIGQLQLAAQKADASSARENSPKTGQFEYFPYYNLVLAYQGSGQADLAAACAIREESEGAIQSSTQSQAFASILDDLKQWRQIENNIQFLERFLAAYPNSRPIETSAQAQQALDKLSSTLAFYEQAKKAPQGKSAELNQANRTVLESMTAAVQSHRSTSDNILSQLHSLAWYADYSSQRRKPSVCTRTLTNEEQQDFVLALKIATDCADGVRGEFEAALTWFCDESERSRQEAAASRQALLAWNQPADPLSAAPVVCSRAPESFSALRTALRDLDARAVIGSFASYKSKADGQLSSARADFETRLGAMSQKVLVPDTRCAGDLKLGNLRRDLETYRVPVAQQLQDGPSGIDLLARERNLDNLMTKLAGDVETRLTGLAKQQGVEAALSTRLNQAASAFRAQPTERTLQPACSVAREARDIATRWIKENTGYVVAQNDAYRTAIDQGFLKMAGLDGTLRQALQQARSGLGRSVPTSNVETWVESNQQAWTAINDWLEGVERQVYERWKQLVAGLGSLDSVRADLAGAAGESPGGSAEVLGEVTRVLDSTRAYEELVNAPSSEALAERWSASLPASMRAVPAVVANEKEVLELWNRSTRVEVLARFMETEGERIDGLIRRASRLPAWAAARRALESFEAGDLDATIRILRSATRKSPDEPLLREMLAYALYLRARSYREGGDSSIALLIMNEACGGAGAEGSILGNLISGGSYDAFRAECSR